LHHENGAFGFRADKTDHVLTFQPYDGVPAVATPTNGEYSECARLP
jgi:hypothetical protein